MREQISGHTGLTALLGHPVSHSLSPLMHNEAFRLLSLDYVYLCFDVDEHNLEEAVRGLKACGIRGFNLTMPNKNRMAELADSLSPAASMTGAVNTVVNDNGRLTGHNTDGVGFLRALKESGFNICGKRMTILGGGGAASAICAQAALDGAEEITVVSRPSSRFHERTMLLLERICRETTCRAGRIDSDDRSALQSALDRSDLLVNATPVGMTPDEGVSPLPDDVSLHPGMTAADIIYQPRETLLLRKAKEAGCRTMNGLYMLLYQGAEAFRLWTGQEMPVNAMSIRRIFDSK